jgi:hypothetical protein
LNPAVLQADSVLAAFEDYLGEERKTLATLQAQDRRKRLPLPEPKAVQWLSWGEGIDAGKTADFSVPRKDRLIRRRGWRFGDRQEYRAELEKGEEKCISA